MKPDLNEANQVFQEMDAKGLQIDRDVCEELIKTAEKALAVAASDKIRGLKVKISKLRNVLKGLDATDRAYSKHLIKANVGRVYPSGFTYSNLNKDCRSMVVADPGQEFWTIDAHAAEIATMAVLSGDQKLLDDCLSGDLYCRMAFRFYGVEAPVPPETRSKAKVAVLVVLYNGLNGIPSEWVEAYPVSAGWLDALYEEILDHQGNYAALTAFGTARVFEEGYNPRSIVSHIIQSTTAEAFRLTLATANSMAKDLKGRVAMSLFDSAVLSLPPESGATAVAEQMEKVLKEAGFPMVLRVTHQGRTWK